MSLAEDVVQDILANAFRVWSYRGVPEHYAALLTAAAKNRALDVFRRERTARRFAPELARFIESEWTIQASIDELFLPDALRDDELRMMFSCCQPRLHEDAQVALILSVLCGFALDEIAGAFLVTPAAIAKRITRGKRAFSRSKRIFELTADDFAARLATVQRALYLLFSEGYHGACAQAVVRRELCHEAMRLVRLLVEHAPSATPRTHALAALMSFGAARLPGRFDEAGNLKGFFEQDRSLWDADLVAEGLTLLQQSAVGEDLSVYHLEAAIAARHGTAATAEETSWREIVELYDALLRIRPSPVVALNRAMAIAQHEGPDRGLAAIRGIEGVERFAAYPFYPASLGELELRSGRTKAAKAHFEAAHLLARNDGERRFLESRIATCERSVEAGRRR